MPTKDGFDLDHDMPLADQAEQQDIGNAYEGALTSPRAFKTSILIAIATATGIAALFIADPVALVTNVTASLVGNSAPQPSVEPPVPTIHSASDAPALTQSVADAQDFSPATKGAPKSDLKSDEVAASEPAAGQDQQDQAETSQDQAANSEPPPDALFRQFQAWAADHDAQANVSPAQPAQDAPAQVEQDAPARALEHAQVRHRLVQRHRQVRAVHNAREEMPTQNLRRSRRVHSARAERPPIQDTRAQERPVQNSPVQSTEAPSFLSAFGQRN